MYFLIFLIKFFIQVTSHVASLTHSRNFFFHQNGETMWKCAITSHKVTNIHTAVFFIEYFISMQMQRRQVACLTWLRHLGGVSSLQRRQLDANMGPLYWLSLDPAGSLPPVIFRV